MNEKPKTMEEEYNKDGVKRNRWAAFVEATVVQFLRDNDLEKLSVEDGNGNKAKLSRTKDDEIKVEHSTTTIL